MGLAEDCLMTWEIPRKRWRKVYQSRVYHVTPKELGCPPTKEASYRVANAWWQKKKAELDAPPRWSVNHDVVEALIGERARAIEAGAWPEAEELHTRLVTVANPDIAPEMAEEIALADIPDKALERLNLARAAGITIPEGTDPRVLEYLFGQARIDLDRRLQSKGLKIPTDRTVAAQINKYVKLEEVRHQAGMLGVSEYDSVRRCLAEFRDWTGADQPIDVLNAEKLEEWWVHLVAQKGSLDYKKKKLRLARTFVGWLVEKGLIPLPPNLHSRRHRFGGGAKTVPTIPEKDAKKLILEASGQLRLHLLLMANCGMTQQDVSDLKQSEINWDKGRIKRKRSKTEDHDDVPLVDYPLWPETFQLLQKYGRREGENALLTETGKTWVRDFLKEDGKRSKVDAIKSNFVHLAKRLKVKYSMKMLRKTSATLLGKDQPDSIVTMFLGHSPRTIAARHYQAPDQARFDAAVTGLRTAYGLV